MHWRSGKFLILNFLNFTRKIIHSQVLLVFLFNKFKYAGNKIFIIVFNSSKQHVISEVKFHLPLFLS